MQGNIHGDGIERSQLPLESCKRKCDSNLECKAFQFKDEMDSECILFKKSEPTGPRMDGFKLCKKLGINLVVIKFQGINKICLIKEFILGISFSFFPQNAFPFPKYQKIVTVVVLIMVDVIKICGQGKCIAIEIMDVVALQVVTGMRKKMKINMTGSPWIVKV